MAKRHDIVIPALFAACVGAALLRLFVTSGGFDLPDDSIILGLRATRLLIVAIVGVGLSISGVLLQALLRNPLASPSILGLSSGAGLGVVVQVWLASIATAGSTGAMISSGSPIGAAVIGAFLALGIVFVLSQRQGGLDPLTLILVGVIVSIMFGALTVFFQQMLSDRGLGAVSRWMLGSVNENASVWLIVLVGTLVGTGLVSAFAISASLDGLMLSDDEARSIGVPVARTRFLCFVIAGVVTASTVVLVGPIGFVGLVCPHIARWLVGPRHRMLLLAAALSGALVLLASEVLIALVRMPSGRIPLGVLTAMLGGPVFIVLLRRGGGHE